MTLPRLYLRNDAIALKNKRLHTEGSEKFDVTIADLTASAKKLYGFSTDSDIRKYLPLNYLRIVNDSGQDLKVYVGQSIQEVIKNNSIFTHHGNFWSFLLENIGSATATGSQIYTTIQRIPDGGQE